MTAASSLPVVIGVCTFRRASLAETLTSLAGLDLLGHEVTVIVSDNDDTPSAAPLVAGFATPPSMVIRHIHAPARNISIARNAILDASRQAGARYLAFLDDDEVATPGWLAALLQRQAETGAAAVVGPVRAFYQPDAPKWMQRGAVHDTRLDPGPEGMLRDGYTSNVLLDLGAPGLDALNFDLGRGRTGGEDTAFFRALIAAGGTIAWTPAAVVQETVPADRASLRWLLRRRYRMGQTHASLLPRGKVARLAAGLLAATKAVACLGMAGVRSYDATGRNKALMRGALHVGAVADLIGLGRIEPYGAIAAKPDQTQEGVK